ncbi:hypothetical protein SUGI_0248170 [Cryptomeria japonica]|nr:hypothetical protein SUGI_0248170 [Cryptomeria japonica]
MDPNMVEPERRNSNSGIANVGEPLQVERSSSPSVDKGLSKGPPKETSNVGIQRNEPLRGTPDTAVQCRQLENNFFSVEFDRVQPDELERGRYKVGLNRIETSAVEVKSFHVDFVVLGDNFQSIESRRDNMIFLEQETSQGSQSINIVMSEKRDSETSETSLEGDNMNIFEQETSGGDQNMDLAMLEKLDSEVSKVSLDGFKPRKQEPNAGVVGPDGC